MDSIVPHHAHQLFTNSHGTGVNGPAKHVTWEGEEIKIKMPKCWRQTSFEWWARSIAQSSSHEQRTLRNWICLRLTREVSQTKAAMKRLARRLKKENKRCNPAIIQPVTPLLLILSVPSLKYLCHTKQSCLSLCIFILITAVVQWSQNVCRRREEEREDWQPGSETEGEKQNLTH